MKWFNFDCCRGLKTDVKEIIEPDVAIPNPAKSSKLSWTDTITLYSTKTDHVSWSHPVHGSLMAKHLCNVFKRGIKKNQDLQTMLEEVVEELGQDRAVGYNLDPEQRSDFQKLFGKADKCYFKQTGELKTSEDFKRLYFNFKSST